MKNIPRCQYALIILGCVEYELCLQNHYIYNVYWSNTKFEASSEDGRFIYSKRENKKSYFTRLFLLTLHNISTLKILLIPFKSQVIYWISSIMRTVGQELYFYYEDNLSILYCAHVTSHEVIIF